MPVKGGAGSGKASHIGDSGDSVIREEERPKWDQLDNAILEGAIKAKRPVVLCFLAEGQTAVDATKLLHGEEVAKLSKESAVFIYIDYNPDRTPSISTGSPIPTSKLAGSNPSRDYDIRSTPCWLVCDEYGNECNRWTGKAPDGGQLVSRVGEVKQRMEAVNTRLDKTLAEARKALDAKNTAGFLKTAAKNFREGVVGLPALGETIKVWNKVMDDARDTIEEVLEVRPKDGEKKLKDLQKAFRGTELEGEIKDALNTLKGK